MGMNAPTKFVAATTIFNHVLINIATPCCARMLTYARWDTTLAVLLLRARQRNAFSTSCQIIAAMAIPTNVPMEEDMFVVSIGTAIIVVLSCADNVTVDVMVPCRTTWKKFLMMRTRQVECDPFGKPKLQVHDLLAS